MKAGDDQAVLHPGGCLGHARQRDGSVDVGQRYSGIVRVDELRARVSTPYTRAAVTEWRA
jgi:hypothetical protein